MLSEVGEIGMGLNDNGGFRKVIRTIKPLAITDFRHIPLKSLTFEAEVPK